MRSKFSELTRKNCMLFVRHLYDTSHFCINLDMKKSSFWRDYRRFTNVSTLTKQTFIIILWHSPKFGGFFLCGILCSTVKGVCYNKEFGLIPVDDISGNKSTVLSSESFEKAVLEIPHQVHDVVPKTRRTQGYHGRIWTSKIALPKCDVPFKWT